MIKINLLESVTDKQGSAVVTVERKVGSAGSRLLLMTLAVGFLTFAAIAWDIVSTQMAKTEAERQLEEQKQIAIQLEAVTKEMKELETKTANIEARIASIRKLRSEQAGPSAVLEAVRERIGMVQGLYLESIDQKGDQLTIKGNSPDEAAVTQFGRSLEFSSGLFSNLNIETQRKEAPNQVSTAPDAPKLELVNFTIRTAYTPGKNPNDAGGTQQATNAAPNAAAPATAANNPAPNPAQNPAQNPPAVKN